eukprot:m51a1_g4679 hypothetical protein (329) ;mRNA; r:153370-158823
MPWHHLRAHPELRGTVGPMVTAPGVCEWRQEPSGPDLFTDPDFATAAMPLAPSMESAFAAWKRPSEVLEKVDGKPVVSPSGMCVHWALFVWKVTEGQHIVVVFNPVYRVAFNSKDAKATTLKATLEASGTKSAVVMMLMQAGKRKGVLECLSGSCIAQTSPCTAPQAVLQRAVRTAHEYLVVCCTSAPGMLGEFGLRVESMHAAVTLRPVRMPWHHLRAHPELRGTVGPVVTAPGVCEWRQEVRVEGSAAELMGFVVPQTQSWPSSPTSLRATLQGLSDKHTLAEFELVGALLRVHVKKVSGDVVVVVRAAKQVSVGLRLFCSSGIHV